MLINYRHVRSMFKFLKLLTSARRCAVVIDPVHLFRIKDVRV